MWYSFWTRIVLLSTVLIVVFFWSLNPLSTRIWNGWRVKNLSFVFSHEPQNRVCCDASRLPSELASACQSWLRSWRMVVYISVLPTLFSKIIQPDWLKYSATDQKNRPLCKNDVFSLIWSKLDQFLNHLKVVTSEKIGGSGVISTLGTWWRCGDGRSFAL